MKRIIYVCPFVPAEWIAAHGLSPERIIPQARAQQAGPEQCVCPFARAFASAAINDENAETVILATTCDQMRRAADIIESNTDKPLFVMNIPHTWQTITAYKMYLNELERLSRFMVSLGGIQPSKSLLCDIMLRYDEKRSRKREQSGETVMTGIPIALVGGPFLREHLAIYRQIEKAGGHVALDASENGERTLPTPFDRRQLKENPILALVDSYFGSISDAFRRPNSMLYQWLKEKLPERGVRGIIYRRYIWCDTWSAEAYRMKEWSGLPFLHLDVGEDGSDDTRTFSRIQSFMEILR